MILNFWGVNTTIMGEKLGNVPFASLISAVIVLVGVGVFCGTLYRAIQIILLNVMEELLEVIQVVFVVAGVVMGIFAIILLVFGFLSTGATRKKVYSGAKCIMGGRLSAAFVLEAGPLFGVALGGAVLVILGMFMIISFTLNIAWLGILCVGMIPVIMYIMINSVCSYEVYNKKSQTIGCLSLDRFGIYRNTSFTGFGLPPPGKDHVCGIEWRRMCDRVLEAGPLFGVALGGAVLVILGMTLFLMTLSSNYTRIKISKELTDYRDAVDMEELDLNSRGGGIFDRDNR
ncbi:hypothetical protein KUTeg_024254 [Tegillarca granosa]|uniref:Uncharacterized protein n=1 Tax=Tegillarca granosa TaxID=220873 RepID=A0ABQ9DWU0_TEGGR|nr:hypothetical protein KUTeg_024254 [Tegillarca granosa]